MNEQQYQQPVQQQYQQPVQPQYQQPYQPQPQYQEPKKEGSGLNGFVDFIVKLLPILIIVFLGMGVISMFYYFIVGIINAVESSYGNAMSYFFSGVANSLSSLARYVFYAALLAIGAKRIKK